MHNEVTQSVLPLWASLRNGHCFLPAQLAMLQPICRVKTLSYPCLLLLVASPCADLQFKVVRERSKGKPRTVHDSLPELTFEPSNCKVEIEQRRYSLMDAATDAGSVQLCNLCLLSGCTAVSQMIQRSLQ